MEPRDEYDRRLAAARALEQRGERDHLFISNLRLVVFAVFAVAGWATFVRHAIGWQWLLLPVVVFVALVVVHNVRLRRLERTRRVLAWYDAGVARLDHRWAGTGRDGAAFATGHAYARDLDLFGPASLFELLN